MGGEQMNTRYKSDTDSGNIAWWFVVSLVVHAAVLFVLPQFKSDKSYKIYPLASAGLIELGPSGGKVGGGPDDSKPGGTGGGGKAHYLNTTPKPNQKIEKNAVPSPPRLGRPKGAEEAPAKVGDLGKGSINTSSNVSSSSRPEMNKGVAGTASDPDIVTSQGGHDGVPVTSNPDAGSTKSQSGLGKIDGSANSVGGSDAQGALAGPGGKGKGAGGPGGDGDFPFSGDGQGFVIKGVPPVYPKYAESNGLEGSVGVKITVSAEGLPDKVQITNSSGQSVLDRACERQIRDSWRFVPTDKGYVLTLAITFGNGLVDMKFDQVKPIH